jgi:Na+/proline symporter
VELTAFSGAVFTAGFFPAVFGGLFLRWGTGKGAFYSMIIGIATTVIWRFGLRFVLPGMKDIHEIIPGFIISLIAYFIICKLTASDMPDKEHLDHVFHTKTS